MDRKGIRNRRRRLGNWASFRARLIATGLPVEVVESFLASAVEWPSRRLPSGAALDISVVLLAVLPLMGAACGAWVAWHPLTGQECGMWVFRALAVAGLGGLAGMAVGLGVGFAATIGLSALPIQRRSSGRES